MSTNKQGFYNVSGSEINDAIPDTAVKRVGNPLGKSHTLQLPLLLISCEARGEPLGKSHACTYRL